MKVLNKKNAFASLRCGLILLFQLGIVTVCFAQTEVVKIKVNADHPDWAYKIGEKVTFSVSAVKGDKILKDVKFNYTIGLERMGPIKEGSSVLSKDLELIDGGSLDKPGFLRCIATAEIEGKKYRGLATAAFEPEHIKPTTDMPKDFVNFWDKTKADAAKIPMDAKMDPLPEKSTATVDVFAVNFQNYQTGSRIYGMLSMPKKPGKYPAILRVPGAGVRGYSADVGMADKGFIVLQIGIHGIPLNMPDTTYQRLANGSLKGYSLSNANNRDTYYFKRVFMGCVRANDFICSLPSYDGKNLAVAGGSQGGALTIATAALDNRVKYMVAYFPGMCDHTGYLFGRTGGWPAWLKNVDKVNKKQIETSKYYDMVNFASLLKIPGLYSWGYNDETCPPTSSYAAYNGIVAPKELFIVKESGHEYMPEQRKKMNAWLEKKLNGK
ncbi:acetylxylan esterase [Pedobacter nyackensis]|uniref:Cephalosporin-C deacetylase n=1 Tax=Pedobacter nyackensis TaxID=475255 RepID=A0A1W2EX90_9SPHI|nr:acetylxylan esterase [Pedobacter nyackensis]SMD14314.1 Cephalosporin-C deacetylase [Pedobacter nyackensis]